MALTIGTRLGRYEVLARLGGGGMGEVYRGRDTKLGRDVAIKVLPATVAANDTRRARFQREAHAIAQLSHPNICAIYDVGEQDGVPYLVMEYIDGETLEQSLTSGGLPWNTALQIAIQIASAVAIAHTHGIVHRDLKPANIMRSGSTIKLLDFGIAKLIDDYEGNRAEARTVSYTEEHKVVGTLNYMAPEQLEKRPIDGRTDIFALGALIYEMLTGRRAFDGKSAASVTAAVIAADPPPLSPPTYTGPPIPSGLEHVMRRALAKSPDDRWQTADDLAHELEWIAEDPRRASAPAAAPSSGHRLLSFATAASLAVAAALILATGAWTGWTLGRSRPLEATFTIEAPEGTEFGNGMGKVAVAPDSSRIAFVASTHGRANLWLYEMATGVSRPLAGSDDAKNPFWSPDSQFVAFYANQNTVIKRVNVLSGAASVVTDVKVESPIGHDPIACWMPDDTIVFSLSDGLYRVPPYGGTPAVFLPLDRTRDEDRVTCSFPIDANRLGYRVSHGPNGFESRIGGAGGSPTVLAGVGSLSSFAGGYLVFHDGLRLLAQPFDRDRSELMGAAVEIAPTVDVNPANFRGNFSASADVLAYFPGAPISWNLVDRYGSRLGAIGEPGHVSQIALARDNSNRVALQYLSTGGMPHIQISDGRGNATTLGHVESGCPVWSWDGLWIAYQRAARGGRTEFRRASPSGANDESVGHVEGQALLLDWSRDGRFLLYTYDNDVWAIDLTDKHQQRLTTVGKVDRAARLSGDGQWLAYSVLEQRAKSIWVQALSDGSEAIRVADDGFDPAWSPNARELYYMRSDGTLMAVAVSASGGARPVFGSPVALFNISPSSMSFYLHVFSVTSDGRFVVAERPPIPSRINVLVNWTARVHP